MSLTDKVVDVLTYFQLIEETLQVVMTGYFKYTYFPQDNVLIPKSKKCTFSLFHIIIILYFYQKK